MNTTTDTAEIKNLKLRAKLLDEIANTERQIKYCVTSGAGLLLRELQAKMGYSRPKKLELTREEFEKIESYLTFVEKDEMWRTAGNKYIESYYDEAKIKKEILNQL